MDVSIIIPSLNEAATIRLAIERAWSSGAAEVIVVDGGSADETPSIAQREPCRFLVSPPGRAIQQNAGAALAKGTALLFQHADNWLAADAARQVTTALQNPRVQGGAFRQRIEAAGIRFRLLEWGNAWRARWLGLAYGDQNIFMRSDVFRQLGGFPEVPLMEDLLLMRKLTRQSRPVLLPGPVHVSARRWERYGVVRQTLRNLSLVTAFHCGVSPERLARFYPRHDEPSNLGQQPNALRRDESGLR